MIKFLDLASQYKSIKNEIDTAVFSVIENATFIGGAELANFETEFSEFCNVRHCIGVGNGTDALEIALEALELPPGSEVMVPANSFIASAEAVTRQGHKVVFVDCCPETYVISIEDVKRRITNNTKAIIAVHLYGHPCDMQALNQIAKKHKLYLIEDCAQAHGAEFCGTKVGGIGDIASFSFYPGKNLGAYGDGGAITTNNDELAKKCRMIANHGRVSKYDHKFEGRNSRLDALQASILSVKLKYLDAWTENRIGCAEYYIDNLKEIEEIVLPKRASWARQVYHLFVIRTQQRDGLRQFLADRNIATGIHYPISLPALEAYKYLGRNTGEMFATDAAKTLLSLPIGEHLSIKQIESVVDAVKDFYRKDR